MLNIRKFLTGLAIIPKTASAADSAGELEVISTNANKLQYHNGTTSSAVVTEAHTATFTNKTIDANGTGNSISNLETADLAAGVLNTSTTLAGATDAQIPSALAVKTYVDNSTSGVQEDVDDLITLSGVPANSTDLGTFTGTTIPDNSDNKEAFQALESGLEAHIADATDAHAGSAITNTPAGTIAATTVQAAINELDGDIQGHINDTTDAHDASAISNVPSGNLSATDVQSALNELQSDIDTRVQRTGSSADNHIVRWDGTTATIQDGSPAVLSDAGIITGLTGLTSSGTVSSTGTLSVAGDLTESQTTDSSATGANAAITNPATTIVRLTNASLTSVDTITSPVSGEVITIINATGNTITINNDTGGTAANRILTGTKAALSLADEASIIVKYDATESRWMVIGGTGSGSGSSLDTIFQLTGNDVPLWSTGDNATFLGGGTLSGTFVSNTSSPLQGLADYLYTQAAGSLNDYLASPAQTVDPRFRGQEVTLYFPYTYNGSNNDIRVIFYDVTNAAEIFSSVYIQAATTPTIFKTNIVIPSTCASIRVGFQVAVLNSGKIFEFDSVQLTSNATVYADLFGADSYIHLNTANGYGATNTVIRRFTNIVSSFGTDIEYTDSATAGMSILIKTSGLYDIAFTDQFSGAQSLGVSKNSNQLTTSILTITNANRLLSTQTNAANASATTAGQFQLEAGDVIRAHNTGQASGATPALSNFFISKVGKNSTNILTAPETFNTDTAPLVYYGSSTYTPATLPNAPIGAVISFTYAANTNTETQTNSAPTQTMSDVALNGFLLTARAYNATSTSAAPCRYDIQIGKNLPGTRVLGYTSTSKNNPIGFALRPLNVAFTNQSGTEWGYDPDTGVLTINSGTDQTATTTQRQCGVRIDTGASTTTAYFTVNASKNPALTGLNINAIAARGVNTAGTSLTTATVLPYDSTKTYDTNSALVAATGIFTAPETGYYIANAAVYFTSAAYTAGQEIIVEGYKQGALYSTGSATVIQANVTDNFGANYSDGVFLTMGQTFEIRVTNGRGATALATTAGRNYFAIHKTNVG